MRRLAVLILSLAACGTPARRPTAMNTNSVGMIGATSIVGRLGITALSGRLPAVRLLVGRIGSDAGPMLDDGGENGCACSAGNGRRHRSSSSWTAGSTLSGVGFQRHVPGRTAA